MRRFIRLTSLSLLFISIMIVIYNLNLTYGVQFHYEEKTLDEYYYIGDNISIPNGNFVVNDKKYEATKVIYYPSGEVLIKNQLEVSIIGKYEIEYRAIIDGKLYKEKTHFYVNDYTYKTYIDGSNAFYGKDISGHNTNKSGITVKLSRGDTFQYNKIIDLNKLSKEDPFIEMFVLPTMGAGYKEVSKLFIELVDIYDSDNFIRITGTSPDDDGGATLWWENNLYVQAGISKDYSVGIEWASGKVHVNNKWGFPVKYSMYGKEDGVNAIGQQMLKFFIDLDTKRVFGPSGISNQYITDLSDPTLYSKTWDGFTTGEVYLRVSAESYQYENFNFMITKAGNHDLAEEIRDKEGPRINVDYGLYTKDTLPIGKVGFSYPVFKANAMDSYTGKADVSVRVWRNYHSSQRYELNVVDNRFKTEEEGTYYIEYRSLDNYGNQTLKVIEVEAINTNEEPNLAIDITNIETESKVGEKVEIASYQVINEGIGFSKVEIFAKLGDEVFSINEKSFTPIKSGMYELTYVITDFTGQTKSESYNLDVVNNDDPVFFEEPRLPEYIIAGFEYVLPELMAYDYIKEEFFTSEIYVTDGVNEEYKVDDLKYTFTKHNSGYVSLKYIAKSDTGSKEFETRIPIIEAFVDRDLKLVNYFNSNTFTKMATRESITLTTLLNSNEANFTFVNPLSSENFNLNFTLSKNKQKVNKIEFILRDMVNAEEAIKISFVKDSVNNTYLIYINDDLTPFDISNDLMNEKTVEIQFFNEDKSFSINGALPFLVRNYLNGTKFNGFNSKKVYLEGHLKEVSGESSLVIYNINDQAMTNDTEDFVRPTIYIDGQYQSVYHLNDVATVFKAYTFDVISPVVVGTLSVQDVDNNYVKDINGLELKNVPLNQEYLLKLTNYGTHLVTYYLNDGSGMSNTRFVYTIFVDDNIKPEITISKDNKKTAKLGEKINISSATANDNLDGEIEVFYFIHTPKQTIISISKNDLTYTFKNSGIHKIVYMAIDKTGNMTTIVNVVSVSK